MADVLQDFPIAAAVDRVYAAITTPRGLDAWWTKTSAGRPDLNTEYELGFGPDYSWRATVTKTVRNAEFELTMTKADADWVGSRIGFTLEPRED